jgi:hypothetical protein
VQQQRAVYASLTDILGLPHEKEQKHHVKPSIVPSDNKEESNVTIHDSEQSFHEHKQFLDAVEQDSNLHVKFTKQLPNCVILDAGFRAIIEDDDLVSPGNVNSFILGLGLDVFLHHAQLLFVNFLLW